MGLDRINYIKEKWSVLEYARDVLGWPVQKSGDRYISLAPDSHNPTALVVFDDFWYDFKQGCGGDVIDLCAEARHGSDKGAAIRELAGDYGYDENWVSYTENLNATIAHWHAEMTETQYRYLRSRKITKQTAERLKIGFNKDENRLIIPYFKNGYVAYYVGRDMSKIKGVSKYKKAYLDGLNENIAWGLHTFEPKHRKIFESESAEDEMPFAEDEQTSANDFLAPRENSDNFSKNGTLRSFADKKNIWDKYVVIAEGAFDAMSFEQEGFRVLSPISGYFNKDVLKQVISLLKTVKCVFVCFDSDNAGSRFTLDFCKLLFKNRIKFVCGTLPEGVKDVSDYYVAGGDLFELVENANSGIEMLASHITDKDDFKKFVYETARFAGKEDVAELIENTTQFSKKWLSVLLKEALKCPPEPIIIDEMIKKYTLKYVENLGFFEYVNGTWIKRSENFIGGYFAGLLGSFFSGSKIGSLDKALKAIITSEELFNRKAIFNFRNCVLELETGKVREHSPADMSSIQMSYEYDPDAQCPKWLKFVNEIMDGREPSIKLLQEMTGYILYSDCSLQKAFFLIGDGANGKSVFLETITEVFGAANISNVEMSTLDSDFQRINLLDSLANISTETGTKIDEAAAYFKQIVTGDAINGCYKGKNHINFKPRCVMISACNEYIKSKDTSDGFLRRICFIDFPRKFKGKDADKNLKNKLLTELPGIFNWAYAGYKRLKANAEFTETPEQVELMDEFIKVSNPIASFIEEELMQEHGQIDRGELYRKYQHWTKEAGHETLSRTRFIQKFRKVIKKYVPNVQEKKLHGYPFFDFSDNFREFTRYE